MIPIEVLRESKTIVTHADCPDGVASAILIRDALPNRRVVFLRHGSEEMTTLVAEPGMVFCDIAPPESRVQEFVDAGAIVLDHHKSARDDVARFGERGIFADEAHEPGVSGATLALREVWSPMMRARQSALGYVERARNAYRFARLASVRDTWQTGDGWWPAACAQAEALRFWPFHYWPSADVFGHAHDSLARMIEIGDVLIERRAESARRALAEGWRFEVEGLRVMVIATRETSDAAEKVRDEVDLLIGFAYQGSPRKLQLSLRSGPKFDCAVFCSEHGGGGHSRAAGCTIDVPRGAPNPYEAIRALIDAEADKKGYP